MYTGRPEDAQRTLRGRSEALRGRRVRAEKQGGSSGRGVEARGGRATEEVGEAESAQVQNGAKQGEEKEGGCGRSGRCGMAQWDGGALLSPEGRETYTGRPEDAQRTLRGRSEALRGRSEGAQRRAESLRGRSEDAQRTFRGAQRTFRGRSEALRGRSEDSQRTFRGRAEECLQRLYGSRRPGSRPRGAAWASWRSPADFPRPRGQRPAGL